MNTIGCMNFFQVVLKIILLKFLGQLCILANFKGKHVYKKRYITKNSNKKQLQYGHKSRQVDQRNKIEDPTMSTCNFSHLIFDTDTKTV